MSNAIDRSRCVIFRIIRDDLTSSPNRAANNDFDVWLRGRPHLLQSCRSRTIDGSLNFIGGCDILAIFLRGKGGILATVDTGYSCV